MTKLGLTFDGRLYCVFRPCAGCGADTLTALRVVDDPRAELVFEAPPAFVTCATCAGLARATFPC